MSKNKHMTLDNMITIRGELDKGTTFKKIAVFLGKDCTTISKDSNPKKPPWAELLTTV